MADATDNDDTPNLSELTDDELRAMADEVKAAGEAVAEKALAEGDAESVNVMTGSAERFTEILDELAARETGRQQEMARAQRAQQILSGPLPGTEPDPTVEDAGDGTEAPAGVEAVAASAELETLAALSAEDLAAVVAFAATTTDTATLATAPADVANTPPVTQTDVTPATADTQEAPTLADNDTTPANETALDLSGIADPVAALANLTPGAVATAAPPAQFAELREGRTWAQPNRLRIKSRVKTPGSLIEFTDRGMVDGANKDNPLSSAQLAEQIAVKYDQVKRFGVTPGGAPITMASAYAQHDVRLGGDPILNAAMLREQAQEFAADVALVASGGNCAIPMNNYDVFNAATEQAPVEGFLRSIGAERGGMRYLAAPDWKASTAGVAVTTDAQDAAGYTNQTPPGPTPPKVCYQAPCPTELECIVDAVSACAGFGNLTYRTAPELVQVLLDQLAVAHAQAKEITYLDGIEAGSTHVTPTVDSYGAIRSSVLALDNAVWAYRKRNHISRNTSIDCLIPDTMIPLIKADAVADLHLGMSFIDVDQETLAAQLFESLNLNVEFYYDYSTNAGIGTGIASSMQEAQAAGHLHNLPTHFRPYFYAPGTWLRLDGGILNVGLVRDSILNSENNLQLFSEEWTQVCKVGFESVALELTLCPSGVGPEPTSDVRDCNS